MSRVFWDVVGVFALLVLGVWALLACWMVRVLRGERCQARQLEESDEQPDATPEPEPEPEADPGAVALVKSLLVCEVLTDPNIPINDRKWREFCAAHGLPIGRGA